MQPLASRTADSKGPIWDEISALDAAEGDTGLASDLLVGLVTGLPEDLCRLRMLLACGQFGDLDEWIDRIIAHAEICGALALQAALLQLGVQARARNVCRAAIALIAVAEEMSRLRTVVAARARMPPVLVGAVCPG